ncbi:hypothetical protein ACGC1H_006402 [Rhizoctonia solani]
MLFPESFIMCHMLACSFFSFFIGLPLSVGTVPVLDLLRLVCYPQAGSCVLSRVWNHECISLATAYSHAGISNLHSTRLTFRASLGLAGHLRLSRPHTTSSNLSGVTSPRQRSRSYDQMEPPLISIPFFPSGPGISL